MSADENSNDSSEALRNWFSQKYHPLTANRSTDNDPQQDWIQCSLRTQGSNLSDLVTMHHLCLIDARQSHFDTHSETPMLESLRVLLTDNKAYEVELVLDFGQQAQLIYPVFEDEEGNPRPPTPEEERQSEDRRLWYHLWTQEFLKIFFCEEESSSSTNDSQQAKFHERRSSGCSIRSLDVRELPTAEYEQLRQQQQDYTYTSLVAKLLQNSPTFLGNLTIQQSYLHVDWEAIARAITTLEKLQSFTFVTPLATSRATDSDNNSLEGRQHDPLPANNPVETIVVGVLEAVLEVPSLRSCTFGRAITNSLDTMIQSKVPFTRGALASVVQHPGINNLAFYHCLLSEDQVLDGLVQGFREEFGGPEFLMTPEGYEDVSDHALFALHKHSQGLQSLSFKGTVLSDTSLAALVHALSTHPTLTFWNLEETTGGRKGNFSSLDEYDRFHARKTARTDYILGMLHWNIALEHIQFTLSERDESVHEKIQFFLDSNRRGLRRLKAGVPRSVWGQAVVRLASPGEISYLFLMLRMRPDLVMEVSLSSSSTGHYKDDGQKKPSVSPLSSLSKWRSMLGAKAKGFTRSSVKATKGLTKSFVRNNIGYSARSTPQGSSVPTSRKGRVPSNTSPRHQDATPPSTATNSASSSRRKKHTTQRKVTGTLLEC